MEYIYLLKFLPWAKRMVPDTAKIVINSPVKLKPIFLSNSMSNFIAKRKIKDENNN